jgi:cytoskeleton protein RodZ
MTDTPSNPPAGSGDQATAAQALVVERAAFGARLKGMREARGVSLASLAQSTRINPHFLAALEAGTLERLPGEVFGRGFVRCIAKTFAEDQEAWVAEYDKICVKPTAPRTTGVLEVEYKSKPAPDRGSALRSNLAALSSLMRRGLGVRLVAAFLALLGVGVGVTKLLDGRLRRGSIYGDVRDAATGAARAFKPQDVTGPTPAKAVETANVPAPAAPAPVAAESSTPDAAAPVAAAPAAAPAAATTPEAAAPQAPAEVAALPSAASEPAAAQPTAPIAAPAAAAEIPATAASPAATEVAVAPAAPASGGQVLELLVSEPVRVRMDVDAGESVVKELTPDTYRFTFTDKADMLIYDAGAVKISFNGRPLGSLGSKGRVRRISFQAASPDAKKL